MCIRLISPDGKFIQPDEESFKKLSEILLGNSDGKNIDLIWGPEIEMKKINDDNPLAQSDEVVNKHVNVVESKECFEKAAAELSIPDNQESFKKLVGGENKEKIDG